MNLSELKQQTRFITNTSTSTYPDADLIFALNTYLDLFTTEIINSMDEWDFSADYAVTDLTQNQQEYVFPTDILKIKRVEVTFDGTNWKECRPMDVNEVTGATDSATTAQNFFKDAPRYDLMDNSLFLYPVPTASIIGGLKIWYEKLPATLANDDDEPNIVRPFHKGLCYGAAKDFFEKYLEAGANSSKALAAGTNMENMIARMNTFYRKKNQDRAYNIEPQFIDYGY